MATNSNNINFTKTKPFEDGNVLYADDLNDLVTLVKGLGDVVQEDESYKLSLYGAADAATGTVLQKDENGDFVWTKITTNGSGGTGIDQTQLQTYLTENNYLKLVEAVTTDPGVNSKLTTNNIILVYDDKA